MNLRIILYSGILIFLTSCNSTDTVILKSKSDLGLYAGDPVFSDLDSVGYVQNIQTVKGEVIYTVKLQRSLGLKKHSRLVLDYGLMSGDPYLRVRNKGFGDRITIKDTITIDTLARKTERLDKVIKNFVDSLAARDNK